MARCAKSWKKKSDWRGYYANLSNAELIKRINDYNKNPGFYRGTVLPAVAREELAKRKKEGRISSLAGKKRKKPAQFGFGW